MGLNYGCVRVGPIGYKGERDLESLKAEEVVWYWLRLG